MCALVHGVGVGWGQLCESFWNLVQLLQRCPVCAGANSQQLSCHAPWYDMSDICVLSLYFNCYSTATTLTTNWDWPDDWACGIVTKSKRAHTHLLQSRLCNKNYPAKSAALRWPAARTRTQKVAEGVQSSQPKWAEGSGLQLKMAGWGSSGQIPTHPLRVELCRWRLHRATRRARHDGRGLRLAGPLFSREPFKFTAVLYLENLKFKI